MTTKTYRPLGTKVLLYIIPQEPESNLVVPDGVNRPGQHQYFQVRGFGSLVNDDKFELKVGETVMIAAHPSQMIGLDKDAQLFLIDREHVVCVVETAKPQN